MGYRNEGTLETVRHGVFYWRESRRGSHYFVFRRVGHTDKWFADARTPYIADMICDALQLQYVDEDDTDK